jgi:YVTN family beta-propeller protein
MISRLRSATLFVIALAVSAGGARAQTAAERPGPLGGGVTLLPNGWRIAPAGSHLDAGDLPLAMALHPGGRYLAITNNGWSKPSVRIVDLQQRQTIRKLALEHAFLGLAWHPDGERVFASGAADNSIAELRWRDRTLEIARTLRLEPPQQRGDDERLINPGFVAGLALSPDAQTLYAASVFGASVTAVDVASGEVVARAPLAAEGYGVAVSPDGGAVWASVWGGARVASFAGRTLAPRGEVAVGEHPNALVLSPDGRRLFVACANTNAVWVVDTAARRAVEQIRVSLAPDDPPGSTPNALALSADGGTLLVANADNNTVAVVDVRDRREARFSGFIPTGWYPTGVAFSRGERELLVLAGKGLAPAANPRGPQPVNAREDAQYIAGLLAGSVSRVPRPDAGALAAMTERVYALRRSGAAPRPDAAPPSAIPRRPGDPTPIRYVFYVIRENRTYDQVLGDMPRGNGDPNLAIFGEEITPNAHALAAEFVQLDNFYVDAEVSADGHAFSTAAYATDAVEKLWPTDYGGRGGLYIAEGGHGDRNPYGNLAAPALGYLWDFAARAGVSVRSYGEFAEWDRPGETVRATVPGLVGSVHPTYPPWDLEVTDTRRVDVWLEELRRFERSGEPPRLSILRLPNDHTGGTRAGRPTPRAMVADNDLALGRLVEAVSGSRFWPQSAIFVLEDDAQNGPDHVDAHRSVLLVASPYARRGALDSTLYTTSGVLRTIELVLGLPPMSQYDAAATPLWAAFTDRPDLRPYTARPARVRLDEVNGEDAPGAAASAAMNFTELDRAPERELNEILWQAMRGAGAAMPPPVRAAFVRPLPEGGDGDD